jgi:sulfide dehydrogenase cytochrome subunit
MATNRSTLQILLISFSLNGISACVSQPPTLESYPAPATQAVAAAQIGLQETAEGWMLAATCFGCHGPHGQSRASAIPSLAGLSQAYFMQVMQAYQHGGRHSSIMGRIALAYDIQELQRMAVYFSRQQPLPKAPYQRVDWDRASRGRQLHQRYCQECHGNSMTKANDNAVTLHGQWMPYLRWTLLDYLVGINQAEAGMSKALTKVVRRHGEAGLEALIHYYGNARP